MPQKPMTNSQKNWSYLKGISLLTRKDYGQYKVWVGQMKNNFSLIKVNKEDKCETVRINGIR